MSHTQGLLATNHDRIESKDDHGWINDGWIIAKCEGPDAVSNARRIVACWNALEGISTEALEDFPLAINGVTNIAVLKQERDELLEAFRDLYTQVMVEFAYCPDPVKFDAIFAKYKEAE